MDTKLKNMMRKWYLKLIAYLVLVICVVQVCVTLWSRQAGELNFEVIGGRFEDSYSLYNPLWEYINAAEKKETYQSVEEIRKADYQEEIRQQLDEPYYMWMDSAGALRISATLSVDKQLMLDYSYEETEEQQYEVNDSETETGRMVDSELTYEQFLKENPQLEDIVKAYCIEERVKEYERAVELLKNESRFAYAVTEGKQKEEATLKEFESAYPVYGYIRENGTCYANTKQLTSSIEYGVIPGKTLFIGMTSEYYNKEANDWAQQEVKVRNLIETCLVLIGIGLLAFLYLVFTTGKRRVEDETHLYAIDRVWSEITWLVGGVSIIGMVAMIAQTFNDFVSGLEYWVLRLWIAGIIALGTVFLVCVLSQIRRIKERKFLEGFLCFRIVRKVFSVVLSSWRSGKLSRRALILAVVLPLLCATWVGVPFVIAFLIYMIYRHMGDFNEIIEGARKIKNGQLRHKIQVKNENGILGGLAGYINSISQGLEAAVSNELRSERLKAELISNVSHDLKTPLTSIVTYVDLLKQESLESETAKDYIDVIDRKAQRLMVLTNDLFEAAKASSGDLPVNLEKVDLNALIRQALGEFDEKISEANLEMKIKLTEQEAYIYADGRLTWRVFENLLSNVVKYGQSGSRVYMGVEEEKTELRFVMKNISAYELNIPAEELMERFKRGDESRNSEGSGLGLSIANSLITLQHGRFQIDVDGDLFKVTIHFPRYAD